MIANSSLYSPGTPVEMSAVDSKQRKRSPLKRSLSSSKQSQVGTGLKRAVSFKNKMEVDGQMQEY